MKFLVDAHLPRRLCSLLAQAGYDAAHTSEMPAGNRTVDETLNERSLNEQRVVVTKDKDFFHSHILHRRPWKLLLVRTGNISTADLCNLVATHLTSILSALDQHTLVELDREQVRTVL